MLNITPSRNADAARDYFARSLSPGDYYAENGGVPSVWLGKGAERLGLHGEEVTGDVFGWLVHNSHSFTGDRLTQRNRANRLPGYDFTFHAPKSVSVAESMGDASIRTAFRDAVRETMGEIELEMQTRVRKGGVHENRTTGNMLWAEFVHDTTRPVDGVPDPQLHCHCYAINATFDEAENCWKAGKFRALKRDAPYYQARFLNNLAFKVQALGYETQRTKSGFELVGVPDTAIKSFSRRSRLIDELADKYGIDDPRAKARIGQWSRESKGMRHTRDDLVGLWHDRMSEQEREAVFETMQRAAMRRDGSLMPVVPDEDPFSTGAVAPSACLQHAIEHCYERRSVVSEKQLAARAIMFGIGRVPSDTINSMIAAGETPEGGRVFLSRQVDDQKLVTTHTVLEEERRMLDLSASTRGTCFGLGVKIAPGSVDNGWMYSIDDGELSPEQYRAAERVLHNRDRVIAISGGAGVGKTRLMREITRGAAYGGTTVFAFAPNAQTVEDTLKKSGFDDAKTVSHLLTNERLQQKLRGQAIWVDEAGQLGAGTMRRL
ncbi:MAG: relaxase domain-containing protein, partial [Phycisphaerales bacterium]|nr:relaxase domain-containing protein [Phycisphaerales bacterium]